MKEDATCHIGLPAPSQTQESKVLLQMAIDSQADSTVLGIGPGPYSLHPRCTHKRLFAYSQKGSEEQHRSSFLFPKPCNPHPECRLSPSEVSSMDIKRVNKYTNTCAYAHAHTHTHTHTHRGTGRRRHKHTQKHRTKGTLLFGLRCGIYRWPGTDEAVIRWLDMVCEKKRRAFTSRPRRTRTEPERTLHP